MRSDRRSRLYRTLTPTAPQAGDPAVAAFEPDEVRRLLRRLSPVFGPRRSWFRPTVEGLEHVPDPPVVLVSNHSGGIGIPDAWGFLACWYRHFGPERPVHVLAHELVFAVGLTGRPLRRLGVVSADPRVGAELIGAHGRDVMVMPGGDVDVYRPFRERWRVRFDGRKGYARLAIQTGAPIVPVANAGAHETLIVLTDGRRFAERIGLPRLARARIFPVSLSVPWGLTIGPWPNLPLPQRLRYRVGAPIRPPAWSGDRPPPDALVDALDAEVRRAVQDLLDELATTAPPSLPRRAARLVRRAASLAPITPPALSRRGT